MYSIKDAISYGLRKLGFDEIRGNQRQVVEAYLSGRDVLMVSPTGSGKSFTFHIAPFVYDYLKRGQQEQIYSICLVIVPLLSLMRDQVASLQSKRIAAVCLAADTTDEEMACIKEGKYNLIFGTPESLRSYRDLFRGVLKEKIDVVFVDESHCVAKW
jgi:ATP-dependent DNA helicase RecQ